MNYIETSKKMRQFYIDGDKLSMLKMSLDAVEKLQGRGQVIEEAVREVKAFLEKKDKDALIAAAVKAVTRKEKMLQEADAKGISPLKGDDFNECILAAMLLTIYFYREGVRKDLLDSLDFCDHPMSVFAQIESCNHYL